LSTTVAGRYVESKVDAVATPLETMLELFIIYSTVNCDNGESHIYSWTHIGYTANNGFIAVS